ncbi:hypothetical protein HanRHA438_Chr01g0020101 [Helianthus annuus]|uniref:Uncharacterized protein n=1 Tax=Helianthus annuus TaxID=4232 RepID=A0A9K3JVN3_HELAN|nr:hypothetical protein HanXRQr2_Chr01g0019521 [Helianthus annuus]KAJ0622498.1 hypothetical protein HanIR_Chr01g0021351 [Helianthus annuus]KAJ0947804.1 hypothetical protein HanRHA438_Chr01g0020101 [Helianthus annuus]
MLMLLYIKGGERQSQYYGSHCLFEMILKDSFFLLCCSIFYLEIFSEFVSAGIRSVYNDQPV